MFVVPAVVFWFQKLFFTPFKVEMFSVAAKLKVQVKTELGTFLLETISVV